MPRHGLVLVLLCSLLQLASAQFRGGSISWEPVSISPGDNRVRFTLRSTWVRSAGTYVKVVDGLAQPQDAYQPVEGDVVKVAGLETPKFVTSTGESFLLEVRVTSNSEQIPHTNAPHEAAHWTYNSLNWFEGTSEYVVSFPRTDVTYVAELQGCCREKSGMENVRDARGITHMFETPYHLTTTIRLDRDPPPLSFLPSFVPLFVGRNIEPPLFLDVPVLDFSTTVRKAPSKVAKHDAETWPAKVLRARMQQQGSVKSLSPGAENTNGINKDKLEMDNILLPVDESAPQNTMPNMPPPAPIAATAAGTGTSVRMVCQDLPRFLDNEGDGCDAYETWCRSGRFVPEPGRKGRQTIAQYKNADGLDASMACCACRQDKLQQLRLFHSRDCSNELDSVSVSCGSDICEGSNAPSHYPTPTDPAHAGGGGRVVGNFSSVLVPAGVALELSPECEFSQPPNASADAEITLENRFERNNTLIGALHDGRSSGCDNRGSNASVCCRLTTAAAVELARTLRCKTKIPGYSRGRTIADDLQFQHTYLEDGRLQIRMYPQALGVGNYPVQLKMASGSSSYTTVEFILHIMLDSQVEAFMPPPNEDVYRQKVASAGFPMNLTWRADERKSRSTYYLFDNIHSHTFGDVMPTARVYGAEIMSLSWRVEWVSAPCVGSVGSYFYCFIGILAAPPYDWQSIQCKLIRVVEDLPPVLAFYTRANAAQPDYRTTQASKYTVFMGQRLEIVAEARDNPSDSIDFLALSKVDINTGDRLRASIKMKPLQVGELHGIQSLWYRPQEVASVPEVEGITPPPFVSLTVGGPAHPPTAAAFSDEVSRTRVLSFVPTRMHSGLEMSVCMIAGDSRGLCRPIGDGTERCIQITVHRCKYALRTGEDLVHVSGLFEVNWVQMWALNPTYLTPEVAAPDGNSTINIGQLYQVRKGEYIHEVARRFGMTMKQVMFFNADLSNQKTPAWTGKLAVDSQLCIVPNSCYTHI